MSIYCVKFDVQSDLFRETKHYCFTCFAGTAKEAKDQCSLEWPKLFNAPGAKTPLRFNVSARKTGIQDVDLLGCRTWRGAPLRGRDCLGIICTAVTKWQH